MKRHHILFLAGLIAIGICFAFTFKSPKAAKMNANTGFALIELYTSEGCSSCPPADRLVAKIQRAYQGQEVYILAYHVDYWNHLGWKDEFSSAQYSERQRGYSNYLNLDGVYTPQAIINGKTEFVGSDEVKMKSSIQVALGRGTSAALRLSNLKITGAKASVQYHTSGIQGNNNLFLAVIEKYAQTNVKSGENGGHTLAHINIVRKLESVGLKSDTGHAEMNLPDGFNTKDWGVIAFVQGSHGEILAVQNVAVEDKEMAAIKSSGK